MACRRSAVRSRLAPPDRQNRNLAFRFFYCSIFRPGLICPFIPPLLPTAMLRLGQWSIVIGALLVLLGLLVGFGAMILGHQGLLLNLIGLIPAGVLLAFGGVCIAALLEPRTGGPEQDQRMPDEDD